MYGVAVATLSLNAFVIYMYADAALELSIVSVWSFAGRPLAFMIGDMFKLNA